MQYAILEQHIGIQQRNNILPKAGALPLLVEYWQQQKARLASLRHAWLGAKANKVSIYEQDPDEKIKQCLKRARLSETSKF